MHCVLCGVTLTNENRVGLVCTSCRIERGKSNRAPHIILTVLYCYMCGKSVQAAGHDIGHPACVGYIFKGGRK
jgi:NMD protein affecting ribosome stability and mRNA decay